MSDDYFKFKYFQQNGDTVEYKSFRENDRIQFTVPVYSQRYSAVRLILEEMKWEKQIAVIDFGCNTMRFFSSLKELKIVEHIFEIDKDKKMLETYRAVVVPYYYRYNWRVTRPLKVTILAGNIADKDVRTKHVDAVIAIELLEHLENDELRKVPSTVFGFIRPKIVIFTTPNYEFNVLFKNDNQFRHPDHKFEWTRQQFCNWTAGIIELYSEYEVKLYGIGPGPVGTEDLGFCSQMAVFTRQCSSNCDEKKSPILKNMPYIEVASYIFDWWNDKLTEAEHISQNISFYIKDLENQRKYDESISAIVPISDILLHVTSFSDIMTDDLLKNLLEKLGYGPLEHIEGGSYGISSFIAYIPKMPLLNFLIKLNRYKMEIWKYEVAKMFCYIFIPIGCFALYHNPELFEKEVIQKLQTEYAPINFKEIEKIEELKEQIRIERLNRHKEELEKLNN